MDFCSVKSGGYELLAGRFDLDTADLCSCSVETAQEPAGGNRYSQMGIHPNGRLQIEGNPRLANVVGFGLFRDRSSVGIEAFDKKLRVFSSPNGPAAMLWHAYPS